MRHEGETEQETNDVGIDTARGLGRFGRSPQILRSARRLQRVRDRGAGSPGQLLKSSPVLLEATGGMEVLLVSALAAASLPVVVVNPRQVLGLR